MNASAAIPQQPPPDGGVLHAAQRMLDIGAQRLEVQTLLHAKARAWMVFLHEGLGSVALWRDTPRALCAALKVNGLVYSRHGYGASSRLGAPRPLDFMQREAEEVLPRVLADLHIEAPVLVGHSDGGSIALLYAAHAPGAVRGVAALAPHTFVEERAVSAIAAARAAYLGGDLRQRLQRFHDDVDGAFFGWNDVWLDARFRDWDVRERIARIACPTLVIQGEDDAYGTMAQVDAITARVAGARALKLTRCGHAPHRDAPEAVAAALAQLLAACGV